MLSKPPHDQTRTSDRPEAGRMLVRFKAVFTMVPESKIAAVGCKGLEKRDGLGRE
ncbi:hypothetical protein [Variovorax sp. Varisp62]|uniref:hypothetical protein n=1 Tax=Variovorax sp. Varisp62 TaxID=3243049 RepID=UPI0039B69444